MGFSQYELRVISSPFTLPLLVAVLIVGYIKYLLEEGLRKEKV